MITRVLVPMDDSEMADRALRYALEVHPNAEITVLHVVGNPSSMMGQAASLALSDDPEETARDRAEGVLRKARDVATGYDHEITTEVRTGHPTRAVLDAAGDYDCVVLGSHSGSLSDRLLVGNVAEKVVRQSPVPVTVVR